jgi:Na+/H+-dicarboxylate symporter
MSNKISRILLIGMLLGIILGFLGGYFMPEMMLKIRFLGVIFFNALKLIAIPLAIVSMILAAATLGDIKKSGKTVGKTILYYLSTTAIAAAIGMILANIFAPGAGVSKYVELVPDPVVASSGKGLLDIIMSLVPGNVYQAAAEGQLLGLVIFAFALGWSLTTLGPTARNLLDLLDTVKRVLMKIITPILYFAPIGILAFIGSLVADNYDRLGMFASSASLYSFVIIIGLLIYGGLILPLILKIYGKKNPYEYLMNMGQALLTAFTTGSSTAALPMTLDGVLEKNKVDKRAGSFAVTLGAAIGRSGTALFVTIASITIAQIYAVDLTILQQVLIFVVSVLASIAAAGIPYAGTVALVFVLNSVGLPLEGIGLIAVFDWLLERFRSLVNVWGDSIGAAVIANTSEFKVIIKPSARTTSNVSKITRPEPTMNRPERTGRPDRYESRPKGPRGGDFQKSERKGEVRRPGYDRGPGQDRHREGYRERDRKEISPIPRTTIEKDLDRLKKQLAPKPEPKEERPKEPMTPSISEPKKEILFEAGIPKFDFFGEGKKDEMSLDKTKAEIPEIKKPVIEKSVIEKPFEPEVAPMPEPEKPKESPKETEPKSESDNPESNGDTWGRIKRKHPNK